MTSSFRTPTSGFSLFFEKIDFFSKKVCRLKIFITFAARKNEMVRSASQVRPPGFHPGNTGSNPVRTTLIL